MKGNKMNDYSVVVSEIGEDKDRVILTVEKVSARDDLVAGAKVFEENREKLEKAKPSKLRFTVSGPKITTSYFADVFTS